MLGMRKVCDKLPRALEGLKPILIYPVVGLLIIGLFMCLINPIVGAINTALYSGLEAMGEGSKIVLGIVLAGMMAVDMGGPFKQGRLCVRHLHSGRHGRRAGLRHHGRRHDRWHGASHRHRPGHHLLQKPLYRR